MLLKPRTDVFPLGMEKAIVSLNKTLVKCKNECHVPFLLPCYKMAGKRSNQKDSEDTRRGERLYLLWK